MEIISGTKDFYISEATSVAIGKFDGVHLGHQRLVMEMKESLSKPGEKLKTCVFTFDPAPEVFFGKDYSLLTTRQEKRILFERKGIDILVEYPFDKETADLEPEAFLDEIIVSRMGAERITAGRDLSFGKGGAGNGALLEEYGKKNGIDVRIIDKISVELDKKYEVSSTVIREMISGARMEDAEALLGIPYFIYGEIVHGNHVGHSLGFPTINIKPAADKLFPPFGVYTSDVCIEGKRYSGLTNIGVKPTVTDEDMIGAETFIYDFDLDVYGKDAEVYLKHFCRPERKFASVNELKAQLTADIDKWRP